MTTVIGPIPAVSDLPAISPAEPDPEIERGSGAGGATLAQRLAPTGNNQAMHVRWARDYELNTSLARNWGVRQKDPDLLESWLRAPLS